MKKRVRVRIIVLIVLLILACIPIHVYMSDGGSEGWYAILWQYTKFHEIRGDGWRVGPQVTLLGFIPIYDGTKIIGRETETASEPPEQSAADPETISTPKEEILGHVAWVGAVPREFSAVVKTKRPETCSGAAPWTINSCSPKRTAPSLPARHLFCTTLPRRRTLRTAQKNQSLLAAGFSSSVLRGASSPPKRASAGPPFSRIRRSLRTWS